MRRWSIAAAFVLTCIAVLVVLLPFDRPSPRGSYFYGSGSTVLASCPSPIVSAWRDEKPASGGWFGYAPLTSTSVIAAQPCQTPARRRLVIAVILGVGALLALLLPRRWQTGASGSQPTLAT